MVAAADSAKRGGLAENKYSHSSTSHDAYPLTLQASTLYKLNHSGPKGPLEALLCLRWNASLRNVTTAAVTNWASGQLRTGSISDR